jgi:hypothetical protein
MTFRMMTFSIATLGIKKNGTLSITAFNIVTIRNATLSITIFSILTLSLGHSE